MFKILRYQRGNQNP